MIKLIWEADNQTIELSVDNSITTHDLLELLDLFIRMTNRKPSGELDYTDQRL